MHPQIYSQDSLYFTLTLVVLRGATLPHLKRGTATTQVTVGGWGVFIPLPFLPNGTMPLLPHSSSPKTEQELSLSLSSSIVDLKPPSKFIDFHINH